MMYTGPIMRTYDTYGHYQYDSAQMARYGYQVMNVQSDKVTNGCWLTTILIFGLLLTPVCIGLLILLLLPTAFSTRLTVYYISAAVPPAYQQQQVGGYAPPAIPPAIPAPVTVPLTDSWARYGQSAQAYPSTGPTPTPTSQPWAGYVDKARVALLSYWQRGPAFRALLIALAAFAIVAGASLFTVSLLWLSGPH